MRGNTVRKQVLVFAGAALLLASAAAAWFVFGLQADDRSLDEMDRVGVLLIVQDETETTGLFSLVILSEHDAAGLCFPADLRLRADDGAFYRADRLLAALGPAATCQAVEALLGIEIPFHVLAYFDQVAAWVDAIGGVPITLDATAIYDDRSGGAPVLTEFRPGTHVLDGAAVNAFATEPSTEGQLGALGRQTALVEALLAHGLRIDRLPQGTGDLAREVLPRVRASLSVGQLAQVIGRLREIPAEEVQVGGLVGVSMEVAGETYTQPQIVETERVLRALLTGEEWIKPGDVRLSVFNGNGVRNLAADTGEYLQESGFRVDVMTNADHFQYDKNYIIVLTEEPKAWVLRDALPWDATVVFPQAMTTTVQGLSGLVPADTDLLLVLGRGTELN